MQQQEVHVNLRGYPGQARSRPARTSHRERARRAQEDPCFHEPQGTRRSATGRRRPSTPSTRAPTRGMSSTRGIAAGRCTRSASTWRRRSRIRQVVANLTGCCAARAVPPRRRLHADSPPKLLGGAAAAALGRPGSTSSSTGCRTRRTGLRLAREASARAAPPGRRAARPRQRGRGARAAAASPGRHREAHRGRRSADLAERASATSRRRSRARARYPPTPAGSASRSRGAFPTFERYVPARPGADLPLDQRASEARGQARARARPAIRFPSDPEETILEQNDVAVLLRSDSLDQRSTTGSEGALRRSRGFPRDEHPRGFAGGGFDGGQSLPKKMAMAAGIPGADLIPDTAELFLGFTSTQKDGLGPRGSPTSRRSATRTAAPTATSRRERRCTSRTSTRISRPGTSTSTFRSGVDTDVPAGLRRVKPGTLTVRAGAQGRRRPRRRSAATTRGSARSATARAIQPASRLDAGRRRRRRDAVPEGHGDPPARGLQHARQPVLLDGRSRARQLPATAAAGLHFVVFTPTSDDFHRSGWRWTASCPTGRSSPSSRARAARASTRC